MESPVKNDRIARANPKLRTERSVKKLSRSNARPQSELVTRRARFGTTAVSRAICAAVRSPVSVGRARYSTRSGSMTRFPTPMSIQENRVRLNAASSLTNCKPRSGWREKGFFTSGAEGTQIQHNADANAHAEKTSSTEEYSEGDRVNHQPMSWLASAATAMRMTNAPEKSRPLRAAG